MRTTFTKRSMFAAGLALALPFGLAACGGGGGKPSKDDVRAGLDNIMEDMGVSAKQLEAAGLPSDALDNYYDCVVDGVYDDGSDDLLKAIADGDQNFQGSSEDQTLLNTTVTECSTDLMN